MSKRGRPPLPPHERCMSDRDYISIRVKDKWEVMSSLSSAFSVAACLECDQFFQGHGETLRESMADADEKFANHACPSQAHRTGGDPA